MATASTLKRIDKDEALCLYHDCSLNQIGRLAHEATLALHPEEYRTYVVDRNINYSNYCAANCIFCDFKADPPGVPPTRKGLPEGYVLSLDEIGRKIEELVGIGGTQVLMQGGLVPAEVLPFDWYLDLMRFIKREFPGVHVHAFSPPEIFAFHKMFGMSIRDVLLRLQDAGLDTVPGGGAEILSDRVRSRISRGKTNTQEYLQVMREAHLVGMRTSMTMMFGHIETIEERIEHLRLVRELQDETGGFTAFICWTFQPGDTPLGRFKQLGADEPIRHDGEHLVLAGSHEYLRTLALSRLLLDNIPNVQASWVTQGPKIGQTALFYGANDMGSVMMEENVVSAAGTIYGLSEHEIRQLIVQAGYAPKKRDCYYGLLE